MKGACLIVAAMLAIGAGCARSDWIERTLVTSDVTGVWEGLFGPDTSFGGGAWWLDVQLVLQQQGPKVTGMLRFSRGNFPGRDLEGTVNGDTFTFHELSGPTMRGEFHVNGDEMTGSMTGWWGRTTTGSGNLHRRP